MRLEARWPVLPRVMNLEAKGVVFYDGDEGYDGLIYPEQEHNEDSVPKPLRYVVYRYLERGNVRYYAKNR